MNGDRVDGCSGECPLYEKMSLGKLNKVEFITDICNGKKLQ